MSSESGQRLPMEELKRRNAPQTMIPQNCPSKEEWQELLHRLDELERHTAAHTALLREVSSRREPCLTQSQMEALARDVAGIQALLRQAGKKKEFSISPPSLGTAMSVMVWLALILLGTMVGMVVLQTVWSGLAALWNAVKILIP